MPHKIIHVVIEEKGVEEDITFNVVSATPSIEIAQEITDDLLAQRDYKNLPRKTWYDLKEQLDEYLSNHASTLPEELDSDAELIYRLVKPRRYPLNILEEAEDFYDNKDPYYNVYIKPVEYIDEY